MPSSKASLLLAATILLCACGTREDEDENVQANQPVSAEGKAEEGKISIKAPGVDLAISVPKELTGDAKASKDSKILYPGAGLAGMAIAAGNGKQEGDTDVEMRFMTADPLDKVVAWYRDPARADGFRLNQAVRDGDGIVITGIQNRDHHPFKVRLTRGRSGSTVGRLTVHHHG